MNKCGGWLESDADGTGGGGDDVYGDGDDGDDDDDLCEGLVWEVDRGLLLPGLAETHLRAPIVEAAKFYIIKMFGLIA